MNKKILAILMALLMVLMSVAAVAEEGAASSTTKTFMTIKKAYTLDGQTKADLDLPEEELTFTAAYKGVTNAEAGAGEETAPTVTVKKKDATAYTVENAITATLPTAAKTGIYQFTITETAGTETGVEYSTQSFDVYVFVAKDANAAYEIKNIYVNNGTAKIDEFTYTNDITTGSVKVTKTITGTLADVTDVFPVTITMTGSQVSSNNTVITASAVTGKTQPTKAGDFNADGTSTTEVWVTNGTEITISNIPVGVTVSAAEAEKDLTIDGITYKSTIGDPVTIAKAATGEIAITNTANAENIPTGVFTDNMPYFMLLAFVMILAAAVVLKKRTVNE